MDERGDIVRQTLREHLVVVVVERAKDTAEQGYAAEKENGGKHLVEYRGKRGRLCDARGNRVDDNLEHIKVSQREEADKDREEKLCEEAAGVAGPNYFNSFFQKSGVIRSRNEVFYGQG